MKKISLLLLVNSLFFSAVLSAENNDTVRQKKELKVLVLIIASDHFPIYVELQKIWKKYMHYDPAHVEAYFIRADPNLPTLYKIEGDTIWSKTTEGWPPHSPGIINKTVLSMEAMLPRLHEFDYVLRTNLSSFYVFPRFLKSLEKLPRKNCYYGSALGHNGASGCGFVMSTDLVKLLVQNKHEVIDSLNHDDILVANFLTKRGIKVIHHERVDLISMDHWNKTTKNMPDTAFQFRIKNDDKLRMLDDIFMHKALLKIFYNITT